MGKLDSVIREIQHVDYARLLPLMARLPLGLAYRLSALRERVNAATGRDWVSVERGTRYVEFQTREAYRLLLPGIAENKLKELVRERFRSESREEFEGRLIASGRVSELRCSFAPDGFINACLHRDNGLLLLTPHFDSFMLGIAFLGQAGVTINVMTSMGAPDQQIIPAVRQHFHKKYRGMEEYMNGGQMLDMESGLRPFYQMLERGECLVILADIPASPGGVTASPLFLGARRRMAGGALRMARKTESNMGSFVCNYLKPGHYRLHGGPILPACDPQALDAAYGFLSDKIEAAPGKWWASYLLPLMAPVDAGTF